MKQLRLLIAGAMTILVTQVQAQTADEILGKHIAAIGGKEKISQVKSIYTEISLDVMGNAAPSVEYVLAGKGFKSETDFNGSKIIQCVTDKGGWTLNPMMGDPNPQAMPDVLYQASKDQIFVGGALADYAAKGYKAELDGKEGNDYKIKLNTGKSDILYYIDPSTYYVTKVVAKGEMMGQPVEVITTFADYKKTDFGIVVPYSRNIDLGQFQLAQKVNKVEVNKEMDPKIFEMPK